MSGLGGVNVAAVTPRDRHGDADFGAALEVIDFLCKAGVAGIALLGSTGEFASLSFDARQRLAYLAVKRSRVPMVVGVGHTTLEGAVSLGREALASGAAGLLVMPPHFFRYDAGDLREYYHQFAALVGTGAAIYLYNIPAFTSELPVDLAAELLATGLFAGIKDSSGRLEYFERLQALPNRSQFRLLIGHDRVFRPARMQGADGVVSGCASAIPEVLLTLDRAIAAKNTIASERFGAHLLDFVTWIERFPAPIGVRTAAELRGLKVGPTAVPLGPEKRARLDEFREWFRAWLPAVLKEAQGV